MESVAVRPQTRSDRTIGVVYLLYFVAAIGATLLGKGLLSPNDPAATASAMLAHESLYRASLAADLIANALYIGVIALLYSLFAPVSQRLSVVAAFFGLVGCSVQIFGSTFRMASLFLLGSNGWLSSFTAEQVHSAALLCLRLHVLTFNTSLVLFGLFNLCIGCLIFGSKLLPKFLGVLMLAAGLGWSTFIWPPLATALSSYIMPLGGTGGTSTNAVAIGPGCEKRSLTPLSGGRLTAGYAIGKPPLMSNVRRQKESMRKQIAILLFIAALPLTVGASQPRPSSIGDIAHCRSNPNIVAACFSLHGRMSLWNGSPSLRIWRIGTNRMLGVLPSESPIIPSALRKYLAFGVRVYGNFVVCPFTAQTPGSMQMVCVQSASRVVVQDLRQDNKEPRVMKLSGTYTLAPNNSVKRTQTR